MKLTVVISAFNEEKNIARVLSSVGFADEIIVVDNESTDKTGEIAARFKAKIFSRPNQLMLNTNKNFGFEKAGSSWILNLDADEEVSGELADEIAKAIGQKDINGYWIPRKNIIFNKWIRHSLWWPDAHLRLFRKGKGSFPCKHVHEYLQVEGESGVLKSPIIHYNYETVSQYLYKMDKIYTENEVENILKAGKKISWSDALVMPANDFLKTFFAQKGYKDGLHGLVLSLLQAFYQVIVFAKVWEKQKFRINEPDNMLTGFLKESRKSASDFRYWQNSSLYDEEKSGITKAVYRLKRKFRI